MRWYRGRQRSETWFEDGGANDEGYYYRRCTTGCREETEHDRIYGCFSCERRQKELNKTNPQPSKEHNGVSNS